MSAIDKYKEHQQAIVEAKRWYGLIGKEYFGGTRGRGGEYGELRSISVEATVYHQEADGANNYHDISSAFSIAISNVVKKKFSEIAAEAFAQLEIDRLALADLARKEHAHLAVEAGLELQ